MRHAWLASWFMFILQPVRQIPDVCMLAEDFDRLQAKPIRLVAAASAARFQYGGHVRISGKHKKSQAPFQAGSQGCQSTAHKIMTAARGTDHPGTGFPSQAPASCQQVTQQS